MGGNGGRGIKTSTTMPPRAQHSTEEGKPYHTIHPQHTCIMVLGDPHGVRETGQSLGVAPSQHVQLLGCLEKATGRPDVPF